MIFLIRARRGHGTGRKASRRRHVVYPLPVMISAIPTGRVEFVCCAIRGPMMGGWRHGGMSVGRALCIMAIGIGWGLGGKAMVDCSGRCDGVE